MVGGLVEQQHVGPRRQGLRQRHALDGAAGQLAERGRAVQLQVVERLVHALLPGPAAERLQAGLHRVEVVAGRVALVARAQLLHLRQRFAHRVEHAGRRVERGLLRHVEAPQPLLHLQQPVVERFEPGEDLQQRRLAGAVAADQRHALAGVERQGRAIEQRHVPVRKVGVGEGEQGHEGAMSVEWGPHAPPVAARGHLRSQRSQPRRDMTSSPSSISPVGSKPNEP